MKFMLSVNHKTLPSLPSVKKDAGVRFGKVEREIPVITQADRAMFQAIGKSNRYTLASVKKTILGK
jgi:hypothetical protein